jgi:hypothetical protein
MDGTNETDIAEAKHGATAARSNLTRIVAIDIRLTSVPFLGCE